MGKATWRTRRQDRRGRGRVLRVCQRGTASISVLLSRSFRPSYPISFPRQFPSVNSIIYRYTLRRRPLFRFSLFPLFRCRRLHRRLFNLIGVLLPPSTLSCFLSLSLSLFLFSLSLHLMLLSRNSAEDGERQRPITKATARGCEIIFGTTTLGDPEGRCLSSEIADGKIFDAGDSGPRGGKLILAWIPSVRLCQAISRRTSPLWTSLLGEITFDFTFRTVHQLSLYTVSIRLVFTRK